MDLNRGIVIDLAVLAGHIEEDENSSECVKVSANRLGKSLVKVLYPKEENKGNIKTCGNCGNGFWHHLGIGVCFNSKKDRFIDINKSNEDCGSWCGPYNNFNQGEKESTENIRPVPDLSDPTSPGFGRERKE